MASLRVTDLAVTTAGAVYQKLRVTDLEVVATLAPVIAPQSFNGDYYAFDSLRIQVAPLYPLVVPDTYNWRVVSPSRTTLGATTSDNARFINSLPAYVNGGNVVIAVSGTKDGFTSPETIFTIPVIEWSEFIRTATGWAGIGPAVRITA